MLVISNKNFQSYLFFSGKVKPNRDSQYHLDHHCTGKRKKYKHSSLVSQSISGKEKKDRQFKYSTIKLITFEESTQGRLSNVWDERIREV
jgi:hypothetical protein